MGRLVVTQNSTVDGSIEMLTDWFDPSAEPADAGLTELTDQHQRDCEAVLLGRITFEDFRGFWPKQHDDTTGISDYLNAIPKYVVSSTITDPGWENSTVLSGEPLDQIRDLKAQVEREIEVTGSITLTHALLEAGLVDEIRLFTYPAIQGAGRGLVPDGCELSLRMLDSRRYGDIQFTSYAVTG